MGLPKVQTKKEILVSAKGIWKSFNTGANDTTVLKNLSVDIYKGEFVILFGPSGCGKSTFLNTLVGLEHPDKGEVEFMGMKIWSLNSDDRAIIRKQNIGTVYQQQNWLKSLDVISNVALVGNLLGYSREKSTNLAAEKLERVGISLRTNYRPYELSSGEQQRISLARCLMNEPPLIVADEPTGNLDVKAGLGVLKYFKEIAENGKTVLMVSHNLESLDFADRILFMLDGKIRKDIQVKDTDINKIKKRILEDINAFIGDVEEGKEVDKVDEEKAPPPVLYKEEFNDRRKRVLKYIDLMKFNVMFVFSMFLLLFVYLPFLLFEKICFKKCTLASKVKDKIMGIFMRIENRKNPLQRSISNWDLGEISLAHLLEKRARSMITIFGVGVGVGFITFLLSIGYGLENLVINEIARIEERRQVVVMPTVNTEVVIDEDRYDLIMSVSGVNEMYPLINVATTIYYGDSQTDVVAYGVETKYLDITGANFLSGVPFNEKKKEVVLGSEVLTMLGVDEKSVLGEEIEIKFVPVGDEVKRIELEDGIEVLGTQDYEVTYSVVGVVAESDAPIIYFPIADAKDSGIEEYSEVVLVLDEGVDMNKTRGDIETLGMRTSSIMDTVDQIQSFFTYFRLSLVVIGVVAFLISVLGMINTLTISLMERTREVGLLKSIGMRSMEINKLFITESMLIAFAGGVVGVVLGLVGGGLISLILSIVSLSQGGDYIIVTEIPFLLIFFIICISVGIGFITGLYPSRRAVRMSPLDALRYE